VIVNEDGGEVKTLTDNQSQDVYPAWSPKGDKIVFASREASAHGLFLIDPESGKLDRLTYGADEGPAWSPDGKTIVFTRHLSGRITQLRTIQVDETDRNKPDATKDEAPRKSRGSKKLIGGTSYEADAAWSPDGKTIAFASDRSGVFRLYLMDADGKNVRDLTKTDNPGGNAYPAWSPDGKQIAFTNSTDNGTRQIFVIDVDGKNKKQLTSGNDFSCYAAWSPDGKKIAYMSFPTRTSKGDLVLMNPDGSEPKVICRDQGAGHNGRPAWKPQAVTAVK
jgi:TolB protein